MEVKMGMEKEMDDIDSNVNSNLNSVSIHDQVALGEYVTALKRKRAVSDDNGTGTGNDKDGHDDGDDDIMRRLPYLLRLLTSSQALSSIPSISNNINNTDNINTTDTNTTQQQQQQQQQQYVDEIISLLEITAATYPESENLELLTSHLLPKVIVNGYRIKNTVRQHQVNANVNTSVNDNASINDNDNVHTSVDKDRDRNSSRQKNKQGKRRGNGNTTHVDTSTSTSANINASKNTVTRNRNQIVKVLNHSSAISTSTSTSKSSLPTSSTSTSTSTSSPSKNNNYKSASTNTHNNHNNNTNNHNHNNHNEENNRPISGNSTRNGNGNGTHGKNQQEQQNSNAKFTNTIIVNGESCSKHYNDSNDSSNTSTAHASNANASNANVSNANAIHYKDNVNGNGNERYYYNYISPGWDTSSLQMIMDQYYQKKEQRMKERGTTNTTTTTTGDNYNNNGDNCGDNRGNDEDDENDDNTKYEKEKKRIRLSLTSTSTSISKIRNGINLKEEDTQEYNVMKTLIELIGLVSSSLKPIQLKVQSSPSLLLSSPLASASSSIAKGNHGSTNTNAIANKNIKSTASGTRTRTRTGGRGEVMNINTGRPSTSSNNNTSNLTLSCTGIQLKINPDSMLTETLTTSTITATTDTTDTTDTTGTTDTNSTSITSPPPHYYAHSNLSAMLTSLLHHVPILRHEHVANALCRASISTTGTTSSSTSIPIPQCAHIIQRLAANSPSTSCSLLRGCINAYHYAFVLLSRCKTKSKNKSNNSTSASNHNNDDDNNDDNNSTTSNDATVTALDTATTTSKRIIKSAKESVAAIANLSKREASHVITILNQSHAMPDLMISLMMQHNHTVALATLLEDLIHEQQIINNNHEHNDNNNHNNNNRISGCGDKSVWTCISNSGKKRNRRLKNAQSRKRKRCTISQVVKKVECKKSWIMESLKGDAVLASKVRQFISSRLESVIIDSKSNQAHDESQSQCAKININTMKCGETTLILQVYAGLIHSIGIEPGSSPGSGSLLVTATMNHITTICEKYQKEARESRAKQEGGVNLVPATAPCRKLDELIKMAISACIFTCIRILSITDETDPSTIQSSSMIACTKCLKRQLEWRGVSKESQGFISTVVSSIHHNCGKELKSFLLDNVVGVVGTNSESQNHFDSISNHDCVKFCQWACTIIEEKKGSAQYQNLQDVTPFNISSLIDGIKHSSSNGEEYDDIISSLLEDTDKCQHLFELEELFQLIDLAVRVMKFRSPPVIPIILPLSIESQVLQLLKKMSKGILERKQRCQIIVQLIYAFTFLDNLPDSPFAINPRSLPLQAIIRLISIKSNKGSHIVQNFVKKYSPETFVGYIDNVPRELRSVLGLPASMNHTVTAIDVGNAIRRRLSISDPYDTHAVEQLFIIARTTQPPSAVDTEASLALLESTKDPIHFLTYAKLCQDPLMLMKCSVRVWIDEGLRRILLAIMQQLLEANESIVKETSTTSEVASEYLVSRDSIILRSWLFILSGVEIGNNQLGCKKLGVRCPLLVSMVRFMVTSRAGLVATMVKQFTPAPMVDWLVIHVLELRSEARIFMNLMEKGTLSAVERLRVADAALRITIAHGCNHEAELQPLAYTALSIIVNSFYHVIGPVGVPANVICDQEGRDTTQMCRQYLFRMFLAVNMIKDDMPSIKNEVRMALSKLAGLCKSDMNLSGLTGTAAQRRKIILTELWDALVRVNTSIGGGIQL